ncbi:MAG: hypothetical protein WC480_01745 [Patescibacteria group bacterium]
MTKKILTLGLMLVVGALFLSGCVKSASDRPINDLTPAAEETNLPLSGNDCEAACANYVNKCLTLVPNADHVLFEDGLNTCLEECADWSANKISCILSSVACSEMSDICEL